MEEVGGGGSGGMSIDCCNLPLPPFFSRRNSGGEERNFILGRGWETERGERTREALQKKVCIWRGGSKKEGEEGRNALDNGRGGGV